MSTTISRRSSESKSDEQQGGDAEDTSIGIGIGLRDISCPISGKVIWQPTFTQNSNLYSRFLSDFEGETLLGYGGFGCVVAVKNKLDELRYAVKKVKLEKVYCVKDEESEVASEEGASEGASEKTNKDDSISFQDAIREVTVMSPLCHPGIVRYYGSWLEAETVGIMKTPTEEEEAESESSEDGLLVDPGPTLFIQMELCDGSLAMLMGKEITDKKIFDIFRQLVEALDYLHSHSVRHGDLSPANIFLDKSKEKLKIADFGLASTTQGVLEEGERLAKTIYTAPELKLKIGAYSCLRSDIYSLGVILVELCARYGPEDVSARPRELMEFIAKGTIPESARQNTSEELIDHIVGMTSREPVNRPTARQLMEYQPWAKHA